MAQSEVDLTTPANAAADLGASAGDAALQRAITAASRVVSNYLGAPLHRRTVAAESVASSGGRYLFLPAVNLVSISSVALGGTALAATEYAIDSAKFARVRRVGALWPFTGIQSGGVVSEPVRSQDTGDVVVGYVAGWITPGQFSINPVSPGAVDLPEDIQQAALEVVTAIWRRRGFDQGVASRSLGGGSVSFRSESVGVLSAATKSLLRPYRRIAGAF